MIKWGLTFAVILLIFWWFIESADQKPLLNSNPNLITQQEKSTTTAIPDNKITAAEKNNQHPSFKAEIATPQTKTQNDYSYLQLYRMHRQWQPCADVIYSIEHPDQAYQPINQLRQKINSHHKEQLTWPTSAQVESVQRHQVRCTALIEKLSAMDLPSLTTQYNLSMHSYLGAQLIKRLHKTQVVTEKEQAIAKVLALIPDWQAAHHAVIQASNQSPSNNQTTDDYLESMLGVTPDQSITKNSIRTQAISKFSEINGLLYQELHSSDPDVFYETQMALEQSTGMASFGYFTFKNIGQIKSKDPFIEYVSPGEMLMQMADLHDGDWFGLVIQHATLLYWCELGGDCGPESQLIGLYCHAGLLELDPVSCDLNYPSFLQRHYLNGNQWDDVQYILSLIKELYE